ncbi:hypothetical protein L3Q82_024355 [Scortum barcoo]|uniref:Uncharacterized protein n=1 Tax=Scortum barcoo TaxID=214431 RepID=A0ACB8WVH4_9TELE|nr:hypothetical protein L3Q82_024355 [Scortum barcoo]
MWQGLQIITDYKTTSPSPTSSDVSFLNELNNFYARFERGNTATATKAAVTPDHQPLTLSPDDVGAVLGRIVVHKAAGPDGIPGRVLRACSGELAEVLTDIFNLSLAHAVVPTCFKSTSIIPVPKNSKPSSLNDYRPVALTPIITKCFERLVLAHLKSCLPPTLDPQPICISSEQEHRGCTDPNTSCLDNHCSSTITINTGVPQGCVMSPFLYSLLTHDCRPADSSNTIIKFADDTTVIGLIKDSDEAAYREEVDRLAEWCDTNNLLLNTGKTKELIVDFRRNADPHTPIHIKGMTVERVNSFKFLGVHISEDLTWTTGCSKLVKKAHQRLFFLRTLRKNHLSSDILVNFYRCTIESILTSCITVWSTTSSSIEDIYRKRCLKRAGKIIKDSSHPAHRLFTLLPSGKRYRSARTKTTRFLNSFFPTAVRLLNSEAGGSRKTHAGTGRTCKLEENRIESLLSLYKYNEIEPSNPLGAEQPKFETDRFMLFVAEIHPSIHLPPLDPGPGHGGSSLSRDAQTSLTPDTSSSSSRGDSEAFPGQPRDIVSPACPGSSPGASSQWDMPGTPP